MAANLHAAERTLEDLFPEAGEGVLQKARDGGYARSLRTANPAELSVKPAGGISLERGADKGEPPYIIENLLLLKNDKPVTKLDIYNALCGIRTLQGIEYFSSTRGKRTVLFEEASRVAGEDDLKKRDDPPPARAAPSAETVFITVKDVNFGNCYYKAELKTEGGGIRYTLTNFKNINYLFIPVIRPENLRIQLYIEAVDEGVLIYGLTSVKTADFADKRADIPSAIQKRLDVIYKWIDSNIALYQNGGKN
ncbi:MAG: hypothetical protein LBH18_00055 [Spirochaetaceae bacterium]|nr:hypothetical protein [Spirochaetaceae bacterium]